MRQKKHVGLLPFLAGVIAFLFSGFYCAAQVHPVIVELFTSQGCSSCPAADKNLTDLLHKAEAEGKPVYGLSFHVDYWNNLGWKDPYSSKDFTARQRSYAQQLGLTSMYTPQMIVNGSVEFVGSNTTKLSAAIAKAEGQVPLYEIAIGGISLSGDMLHVGYRLDKKPQEGDIIHAAIVAREVENEVLRGENSGRKLHHENVVRLFASYPAQLSGQMQLNLPSLQRDNTLLILYVQQSDWQIVGAAEKSLNQ